MKEVLDVPQPIICGLTREDYDKMRLSKADKKFKTWIFLDRNEIEWSQGDSDVFGNNAKAERVR